MSATSATPVSSAGFAFTITTLRPVSGYERAELICDVVDAFRRLRDSIERFDRLLTHGTAAQSVQSGASLQPLLAALSRHTELAGFTRQRELRRAICDARRLDKTRDALFSDAFCVDTEALRRAVMELGRLDKAFVGLGVEHVLRQHANTVEVGDVAHRRTVGTVAAGQEREPAA